MMRNAQRRLRAALMGLAMLLYGDSNDAYARSIEVADCTGGDATEEGSARYVLTTDIDCSDERDPLLVLAPSSVLELAGHTLRNGDVVCAGSCRIVGPGTISGGGVFADGKVTVLRAIITGSPSNGVLAINTRGHARATIIDSVIAGNAMTGVEADRMTRIIRSTITDNGRHGVAVSLQPFNDCKRGRIRSWGSAVSGNGRDGACGTNEVCADVATCAHRGVELRLTECNTSYELGSGIPGRNCGSCALD